MLVPKSDGTVKVKLNPEQRESLGETVGIMRVASAEFPVYKQCSKRLAEFHMALEANAGEYDPNPPEPSAPTE
jgi:Ser/Thr protein kinase RdoA (MazF antagonist)